MEEKRYRLQTGDTLSLPRAAVQKLLSLGDGDAALVYLYFLRADGRVSPTECARDLGRTEEQVRLAMTRLQRIGLLTECDTPQPMAGAFELPEYTAEELAARCREDGALQALVQELARIFGHALSRGDLQTLTGIYDRLGLPPEVIFMLVNFCAERTRKKYGDGRLPTMHAIEQEAYRWVNRELMTLSAAEEYINAVHRRDGDMDKLRELLQLGGREPSATERKYMESWLEMGFGIEALSLAYDRTVTGTGRLAWAYMNKILKSWYEKRLFTVADIEKGDGRGGKRQTGGAKQPEAPRTAPKDDLDWLMKSVEKK